MSLLVAEIDAMPEPNITIGPFVDGFFHLAYEIDPTFKELRTLPSVSEMDSREHARLSIVRCAIGKVSWAAYELLEEFRMVEGFEELDVVQVGFAERLWRALKGLEVDFEPEQEVFERYIAYVESILRQYEVMPDDYVVSVEADEPHCYLGISRSWEEPASLIVTDGLDLDISCEDGVGVDGLTGQDFFDFVSDRVYFVELLASRGLQDVLICAQNIFPRDKLKDVRGEQVMHLVYLLREKGNFGLTNRERELLGGVLEEFRRMVWAQNYIPLIEGTCSTWDLEFGI